MESSEQDCEQAFLQIYAARENLKETTLEDLDLVFFTDGSLFIIHKTS